MIQCFVDLDSGMIRDDTIVRPQEASGSDLLVVHTKEYLANLRVILCTCILILKVYVLLNQIISQGCSI